MWIAPAQGAFVVLVGFTDVEHDRAVGDVGCSGLGVDLADLGLGGGEQVAERCHAESLPLGQDSALRRRP